MFSSAIDRALAPIPAPVALYLLLGAGFVVLTLAATAQAVRLIRAQAFERAYFVVAGLILAYVAIDTGHDTIHHVLRIEAWAEQLRRGNFSPLIINLTTGEVSPLLLYYSALPYLLPTALVFIGFSAALALQTALVVEFLLFAVAIHMLIVRATTTTISDQRSAFCAGIVLLTANCVYLDWIGRAALAEIWAYALIPLAILYIRDRKDFAKLVFVFFLQIGAHPLVFLFGFIGTFAAAALLFQRPPLDLAKTAAPAAAAALIVATPFWMPAAFYMHDVLGLAGLPADFGGSFQRPWKLLDPMSLATVGPALIVAVGWILVLAVRARDRRFIAGTLLFYALLVLQTNLLRDLVTRAPLIAETQFIWRLMFPCAVLGFALILSFANTRGEAHRTGLARLAIAAVLLLTLKLGSGLPRSVGNIHEILAPPRMSVSDYFVNFPPDNLRAWGVRLFSPNYATLAEHCPAAGERFASTTYAQLRAPFRAGSTYVSVAAGPIGFVRYVSAGGEVGLAHCGTALVLGPVTPGSLLAVDETTLASLQKFRLLDLLAVILLVFATFARGDAKDRQRN